jgi:hypothetical protein
VIKKINAIKLCTLALDEKADLYGRKITGKQSKGSKVGGE